jgi:mitochondrial fission protein ELM1
MDKSSFKTTFMDLLKADVEGLTQESKIKYMKKWLRENEQDQQSQVEVRDQQADLKIGILVNTTFKKLVASQSLSNKMIVLLQDERYSKNTFDINFPFLKKIDWGTSLSDQRKVNGYKILIGSTSHYLSSNPSKVYFLWIDYISHMRVQDYKYQKYILLAFYLSL